MEGRTRVENDDEDVTAVLTDDNKKIVLSDMGQDLKNPLDQVCMSYM